MLGHKGKPIIWSFHLLQDVVYAGGEFASYRQVCSSFPAQIAVGTFQN